MKYRAEQEKKDSKFFKILLPVLVLLVVASIFGIRLWYTENLKPVNRASEKLVSFEIALGDSVSDIADGLENSGLIRNSTAFKWYVRGEQSGISLQAGNYNISPAMSIEIIVDIFAEGRINSELVTILPGKRLDETRQELIRAGWSVAEVDTALEAAYNSPLLKDKPKTASLEGYIYPDSYQINDNTGLEELIGVTLDNFYDKIQERDIEASLKQQGLNLHEAIILASIVYMESGDVEDQRQIAQVFLKRLNEGLTLGADATFRYASAVLGQEDSIAVDSPYNTRVHSGLPPGPIANFNISALVAVADPAPGDYLYFVSGDDGITRFSKTFEEHQALTEKYCKELCEL